MPIDWDGMHHPGHQLICHIRDSGPDHRGSWHARSHERTPGRRVPSLKGFEQVNSKGVGYRWNDGKGNGVRIGQGNKNNSQVYQQVDHVVINSGGKVIGRDGKAISGSIKDNAWAAHVPVEDWLKWKAWNKP